MLLRSLLLGLLWRRLGLLLLLLLLVLEGNVLWTRRHGRGSRHRLLLLLLACLVYQAVYVWRRPSPSLVGSRPLHMWLRLRLLLRLLRLLLLLLVYARMVLQLGLLWPARDILRLWGRRRRWRRRRRRRWRWLVNANGNHP